MKNQPEKIYLQIGADCDHDVDFNELVGVTWNKDRINKNDVEYVREDLNKLIRLEVGDCVAKYDGEHLIVAHVIIRTEDDLAISNHGLSFFREYNVNRITLSNGVSWDNEKFKILKS